MDENERDSKLDEILRQTRQTNGRVGHLETVVAEHARVLYGDDRIDGDEGLIMRSRGVQTMLREWRSLKVAFGAFALALLSVGGGWLLHTITA